MFKKKTTIILGAGASAHLGYPTGAKLIEAIINSKVKSKFFLNIKLRNLYDTFVKRLQEINPLSIDTFLSYNQEFVDKAEGNFGRKAIAYELLQCENEKMKTLHDKCGKPMENWYRYLVDALITGCSKSSDLLLNIPNFTIVTFNYDLSLEYYLYDRLNKVSFFDEKDRVDFFKKIKIIHVYGQLGAFEWHRDFCEQMYKDNDQLLYRKITSYCTPNYKTDLMRQVEQYASSIEVVGTEKWDPENLPFHITEIQKYIKAADTLFILGFGFYEENIKLIGLGNVLGGSSKRLFYTNFGDHQKIFRKIGHNGIKSTKKIETALKEDFDLIEY